ncbi:hypothetical protein ACIRPQ_03335 [Streptomyces sp. NPDC101213]|uniref:hypothetical protein n=1 Tax=Streptomyces sp. NPDC101213 TaxID=3366130 RepID=UPI0038245A41
MSLTELAASSRVTVFPLEALTVAYTTRSGDEHSEGEELWRLARDLGGRTQEKDQARWILTQASRARTVRAHVDLPGARWTAHIRRRFVLEALFANHAVLMTGRIVLPDL